ncbi:tRNA-uridine aminocarboxypropyltransferase [Alicycliphilus denitrificans]|uniref:tRNA-uridine aminocarboxypropyltransferase n=1 Tax=Alicycliphilus denitrificans TaxID=179636 RepID=UPI00384BF15C
MPHAVSRLRAERLARSAKPFQARGGSRLVHCPDCRLVTSHCQCALRQQLATRAGLCLLMHDTEPLKPSNTGWLVADVVADTYAFGWARTEVDPALLALLADPQWQPYVVFPGEFVDPGRVLHELAPAAGPVLRRPLFVLLDATWPEARKMFRKSPYLERFPVLSLHGDQASRYRLRRSRCGAHFCTAEVAALCLEQAGEAPAGALLQAWLEVYSERYLLAKNQRPVDLDSSAHQQLRALMAAQA